MERWMDDDAAADLGEPDDVKFPGVAIARVIENTDLGTLGRVQLSLPWLPEIEPWARVAVPAAGDDAGTYFIPQVGDEVLVAFDRGDVRHPYVLGVLWSTAARPPALLPEDPSQRRIIRTPEGLTLEFDDVEESVTISTRLGQTIKVDPDVIELETAQSACKATLEAGGDLTLEANGTLALKATQITIEATGSLKLGGDSGVDLSSSATCKLSGS